MTHLIYINMPRRSIDTKIFSDNWFTGLDPLERYLFLYFLINEHTTLCGIYELPLRIMAFESGLDMDMLAKIIGRFTEDKKVFYKDGWLFVVNYEKYQVMNTNMKLNSQRLKERTPIEVMNFFKGLLNPSESLPNSTYKDKDKDRYKDKDKVLGDLKKSLKSKAIIK
jgi:hypothetical protein